LFIVDVPLGFFQHVLFVSRRLWMAEGSANTISIGPDQKNRFLLVVDSDANSLYSTSMLLQRFHYKTVSAATAREALTIAAVKVPALVVTALDLKDMNGLDLAQQFRQKPGTAGVRFLVLRKQDDLIGEQGCLDQGVTCCLTRPVSVEDLYRAVQTAAEKTPRKHIRIRTLLPVQARKTQNDCLDNACTTDLSERGMFVRTERPASAKTQFCCSLHLYGQVIEVDAAVLYSNRKNGGTFHEPGMGIEFVRIAPKDQELIRRFIRNEVTRGIAPLNA
jgi:CheY-like chemotaxis protein